MTATVRVAISLGSNEGDRAGNLRFGVAGLERLLGSVACSSVFETSPLHTTDQPRFLNACCIGLTRQPAVDLFAELKRIEGEAGRDRDGPRYGPRPLDLDLILYGDRVIDLPDLIVPHPRMRERGFVLVPLAEIAPDWVVPASYGHQAAIVADLARALGAEGVDAWDLEVGP